MTTCMHLTSFRWLVPEPCWLHPDDLVEDESEDDDELGIEYGYSRGRKVILLQNKPSCPRY
jgi:hypothetical protein